MITTTFEKHDFRPRAGNTFKCSTCREPEGAEIHLHVPEWRQEQQPETPAPQPAAAPDHSPVAKNGSSNGNGAATKPEPPAALPTASGRKPHRSRAGVYKYVSLSFDPSIYAELEAAANAKGMSPSTYAFGVIAGDLGYTFEPARWAKKN